MPNPDDPEKARQQIQDFVARFGLTSEDLKNLSISALMMKLIAGADKEQKGVLNSLLNTVKELGVGDMPAKKFGIKGK